MIFDEIYSREQKTGWLLNLIDENYIYYDFNVEKISYEIIKGEVHTSHSFDVTEYKRTDKGYTSKTLSSYCIFASKMEADTAGVKALEESKIRLENTLQHINIRISEYK